MDHDSQQNGRATPSGKQRTSWYSVTSPRNSIGSNGSHSRRSSLAFQHGVDLDDAFDDHEDLSPANVISGHHALKRESIGGIADLQKELEKDWSADAQDDMPKDTPKVEVKEPPLETMEEISLGMETVSLNDLPRGIQPPVIQTDLVEDVMRERTSPMTPAIVISRPGSLDSDSTNEETFYTGLPDPPTPSGSHGKQHVEVAVRAPIPRRIIVPPPSQTLASSVKIIQGPQTPTSPSHNTTLQHETTARSSTGSPSLRTATDSRKPSIPSSTSLHISVSSATNHPSPRMKSPGPSTRPRRATGISTQDVVSKTRPSHLPPKSKEEDQRHIKAWEDMMQKSRLADEQRKQKLRERRLAREQAVEDSLHQWEREVMPDWKAAVRDPRLRRLWWKGIPTKIRGQIWYLTLGNALALSKDAYRSCLARAKRAISSNSFPEDSMRQIEEDIRSTLPGLHLFHPETGPMYQDLKDLLCAWVVSRSDEGLSYVQGASTVGAMFLINMPCEQAFVAMRNMIERHCLRSFYGGPQAAEDVEAYYRIFDTLLADVMPKVYFNFKQHTVAPALYLRDWLMTIFLHHLPFEACSRIWDVLILEGDSFLFRTAIAILGVIESRLFFPDQKELLEVLHGENKAALEVARRTESLVVDLGARYEQYGMTEEALWERLEQTEWKDSTWNRLIQRELPDI